MSRRQAITRYLASRLLLAPLMLWLIATLVFLLLRVAPGDPVDALLGNRASAVAREQLRAQLGLDQPLLQQYGQFFWDLLHGDLGTSLNNSRSVLEIVQQALPASVELGLAGLLVAAVLGLAVGFSGVARPEGRLDLAGRLYGIGTYALPAFWAAMVLQLIFAVGLGLVSGGRPLSPHPGATNGHRLLSARWSAARRWPGDPRQPAPPGTTGDHAGAAAQRHL